MVIRQAVIEDAAQLTRLIGELGYPASDDALHARLQDLLSRRPDYLVAIAQRRGTIIGVIAAARGLHIEHDGLVGRVTALSVAPEFRRQGVGARLLAYAEAWLRRGGATALIINSHIRRGDAHRFYQREGYAINGVRFHKEL